MTIRYSPDTCSCIIDIAHGTFKYVNWVQKCPGHADKEAQDLVDTILTHNKSFSITKSDQKIKSKRKENVKLKRAEKNRIRKLGEVIKHGK